MPVKAIVEKILSDAEKEAGAIHTEFSREVDKLEEGKKKEIERIKADAVEKGKVQGEEKARRLLLSEEMAARKALLQFKQELIDETFRLAYNRIRQLKDRQYRQFIRDLIMRIVETGNEEVIVGKRDAKQIDVHFIHGVNRQLKKAGKEGKLRLGKPSPEIDGGVILRYGRKEVNATLSAIFNAARQELESKVAGLLFEEDE